MYKKIVITSNECGSSNGSKSSINKHPVYNNSAEFGTKYWSGGWVSSTYIHGCVREMQRWDYTTDWCNFTFCLFGYARLSCKKITCVWEKNKKIAFGVLFGIEYKRHIVSSFGWTN